MTTHALTAHTYGRIDHDDVVLVVVMQIVHKFTHLVQRISHWVKSKHPSLVHVVDVIPHRLQGNACLTVVVDHLGHLIDIPVAISAIVEL